MGLKNRLGTLGANYRTNVLYDFSLVSKAVFHIFDYEGEDDSSFPFNLMDKTSEFRFSGKLTHKEALPVQINPNSIRINYGGTIGSSRQKNTTPKTSSRLGNYEIVRKANEYSGGAFDIDLEYDVYDEYMMRTAEGVIGKSSMSLLSSNDTSLRKLCEFSCMPDIYVLFEWGDIECFGIFESVNTTFNTFSQWGIPLKASANINIRKQVLETTIDHKEKSPKSTTVISTADFAKMKSYRTLENVALTSQLIATQALR